MPVVRRATENQNTTWIPLPETPLARFVLVKPALKFSDRFGNWQVQFGLSLHTEWRERLIPIRDLPPNTQQSDRAFYSPNLSLGFINREGVYQSTNLIDFMTACFGTQGGKKFRKWVEAGGGPPRPLDRDDDKAEIAMIGDWLGWMEGLEVFGSIRHEPDRAGTGTMYPRFGGAMPIGSLPKEPEPDYQTMAEGKFRSMELETKAADEAYEAYLKNGKTTAVAIPPRQRTAAPARPAEEVKAAEEPKLRYDAYGRPVDADGNLIDGHDPGDEDDPPF